MKYILCTFILFSMGTASAALEGAWKLTGMNYRGEDIPLPNPDLNLQWTFFSNGTARLYWDRGTPEFCERFSSFVHEGDFLKEEVFAVNPKNAVDCGKDPDMQVGRKTQTRIRLDGDSRIFMHLQMGDDILIYIYSPILFGLPQVGH